MSNLNKLILFSFCSTLLFQSCKKNTSLNEKSSTIPIKVKVTNVRNNSVTSYLTLNGTTIYQKKENIKSNVTGYISSLPYALGNSIKRGNTFAWVRTKEQDALQEASKIDSSLKKFVHPVPLRSNVTGSITQLNVVKNDYVAEGDVLGVISDPKSLIIKVSVPYEYQNLLNINAKCSVILPDKKIIEGSVTSILPIVDAITQTQNVLIDIPNTTLPENLNVQVKLIKLQENNGLTVPKTAIQSDELLSQFWVMKIHNDTLATKASILPIIENDSLVQFTSNNLKVNDVIVTEGSYQLQDSTIVSVQN